MRKQNCTGQPVQPAVVAAEPQVVEVQPVAAPVQPAVAAPEPQPVNAQPQAQAQPQKPEEDVIIKDNMTGEILKVAEELQASRIEPELNETEEQKTARFKKENYEAARIIYIILGVAVVIFFFIAAGYFGGVSKDLANTGFGFGIDLRSEDGMAKLLAGAAMAMRMTGIFFGAVLVWLGIRIGKN